MKTKISIGFLVWCFSFALGLSLGSPKKNKEELVAQENVIDTTSDFPVPIFCDLSPPPKPIEYEMIGLKEVMPVFSGCAERPTPNKRKKCSDQALLDFVYSRLQYPQDARSGRCHGTVVVQFIIKKDGSVMNPKVVRDIGCGFGKAALDVVRQMPKWTPGSQRGIPVDVQFNLPIRINME